MHSSTATLHGARTKPVTRAWKGKGWLERDTRYFHDNVNWNWFKDLVPRLMGWITGRQVGKAMAEVT
jgi:hypothetical protein